MPHGNDIAALKDLIESYRLGWTTLDSQKLQSLWDSTYDTVYLPVELGEAIRGRQAIDRYFDNVVSHIRTVHSMELDQPTIDVFGDIAYAYFTFRFEGDMPGDPGFVVHGRVTIVFRRVNDTWKGVHYHESRDPADTR